MIPKEFKGESLKNWYDVFTDVATVIGGSFGIMWLLIDLQFTRVRIVAAMGVAVYCWLDAVTLLIAIAGLGLAGYKGLKLLLFFQRIKIGNGK